MPQTVKTQPWGCSRAKKTKNLITVLRRAICAPTGSGDLGVENRLGLGTLRGWSRGLRRTQLVWTKKKFDGGVKNSRLKKRQRVNRCLRTKCLLRSLKTVGEVMTELGNKRPTEGPDRKSRLPTQTHRGSETFGAVHKQSAEILEREAWRVSKTAKRGIAFRRVNLVPGAEPRGSISLQKKGKR